MKSQNVPGVKTIGVLSKSELVGASRATTIRAGSGREALSFGAPPEALEPERAAGPSWPGSGEPGHNKSVRRGFVERR